MQAKTNCFDLTAVFDLNGEYKAESVAGNDVRYFHDIHVVLLFHNYVIIT